MNAGSAPTETSPTTTEWTILSLIEWCANYLAQHQRDEARLHAELLVAHALKCSRLELYTNFDKPLSREELARFKVMLKRRLMREPLQYIIGETEFMGIPLEVNAHVLIPRPETEQLVERVLEAVPSIDSKPVEILDIGTGSGNIPIAISEFAPSTRVTSLDISADAIAVAKSNADRNKVNAITFVCSDIFGDVIPRGPFDIIVSNPPYISASEFELLQPEVRDFEPRIATTDGGDGLRFFRRIAEIAMVHLKPRGYLFLEIAYNQSEAVTGILQEAGLSEVMLFKDHAGHTRIASARHA